jgi:O-antigen ligase
VKASANAFESFLNLPFIEQFFGIGYGGFIARNLGQGLNAHNGVLLILIELGILGFIMYLLIVLGLIWKSFTIGNFSPVLMVLIFVVIYAIGQNYELTQATTFIFVFTLFGEIQSHSNKKLQMPELGSISM